MSSDISLSPTSPDFAAACSRSEGVAQPFRRRITYVFISVDVLMISSVVVALVRLGWLMGETGESSGADREGQRDRLGAVARDVPGTERDLVVACREFSGARAATEGDAIGPGAATCADQREHADLADAAPAVVALAHGAAVTAAALAGREAPDREGHAGGLGERERDRGAPVHRRDRCCAPRADDEALVAQFGGGDHRCGRVRWGRVMGAVAGRDAVAVTVALGARPTAVGGDAA